MNKLARQISMNAVSPFTIAFWCFFLIAVSLLRAPSTAFGETLRVTAAADLMSVLPEISRQFTKKTHVTVRISYSSSGESAIAIRHHAPFDLFLSADSSFPEKLSKRGWVIADSVKTYTKGILVLWLPDKALPSGTTGKIGTSTLLDPGIRKVALANPRLAPYGHAGMECLKSRKLWAPLHKKLVYANTLAQVSQYMRTKTADAGFLSKAQAMILSRHLKGATIELSPGCVPDLDQKMAIVKTSSHLKEARDFEDFILGQQTQDFLKSHGYR
ncbi:MAG: molybdate ABC transporter substrate-binding protein [Leptospirillum sp.]|jgi:molybdate transport system substrate-binding protein